jgi:hypothetical protein
VTRFGALLLAAGLLLAVIVVLRRRSETVAMPPQAPRDAASGDDDIDWDELERAEREVRDLGDDGTGAAPEQADGEDWGPGTPKSPPAG